VFYLYKSLSQYDSFSLNSVRKNLCSGIFTPFSYLFRDSLGNPFYGEDRSNLINLFGTMPSTKANKSFLKPSGRKTSFISFDSKVLHAKDSKHRKKRFVLYPDGELE